MKSRIWMGALVAGLFAGTALAQTEYTTTTTTTREEEDRDRGLRDTLSITVGGGVEGYSGALATRLDPGFTWGARIGVQPLTWMGAEIGYSGAVNERDSRFAPSPEGAVNGADMVRNGGDVSLTFNAPVRYVQPYALAGIGIDFYNSRGTEEFGFSDDTSGRVPLGAGVRTRVGALTADARVQYDVLFSQQFARPTEDSGIGGVYSGVLSVGGNF